MDMGEVPLSLHLDAKAMERLQREARQREMPVGDLARSVIERFLEIQDIEREIMAQRIAEADKGVFISEEAMLRWMERLDDDIDAPPPEPDVFLKPQA
jgi:predicted transcriptional regulator